MELRLPAFLGIGIGIGIGYVADAAAKITGKSLSVSSIRVRNFMGTTYFTSSVINTGSVPPVELEEGLARTLRYAFLKDNTNKQTYDTE